MNLLILTFLLENNILKDNSKEVTDELLLKIAHDNLAFRKLYDLSYQSIYGFAYSIVKNPSDAQDVVHDTYIKAYNSIDKYRPMGKPMAWLFTITRNLCLATVRKRGRTISIDEHEGLENLFQVLPETTHEHHYILQKALSSLGEDSRRIVVLHAVSDLKHREIAEILDMKLSTVLSKYNRAINKLKILIEGELENGK